MNMLTNIKLAECIEYKTTYFQLNPSCQQDNIYSNWKELFKKKSEIALNVMISLKVTFQIWFGFLKPRLKL